MTSLSNAVLKSDDASFAADPTPATAPDPLLEELESLRGPPGSASHLGRVLARYWIEFPRRSLAHRRRLLEAVSRRVRSGELDALALAVLALADPDDAIVREATTDYVASTPVSIERREGLLEEALEWIRRGLPVNRVAVFEALLGQDDPSIHARLAALRRLLDEAQ